MSFPLEPGSDEMRRMVGAALSYLSEFVQGLPDAPASGAGGAEELAAALRERSPPDEGRPFEEHLEVISRAAAAAFETAGPGYLAYIPGGGVFAAALADLIADTTNRFTGMWHPAPALVQLEANVIDWLADLFGYPDEARGILTSGGSLANFSAIVAARESRLAEEFLDGAVYVTDQTHASVAKAASLAGFRPRSLRRVAVTDELRMDVADLRSRVKSDRDAGLRPFCVVASAGTTNTGAVDPIVEIGQVAAEEGLWLHVDGAYGGFFQLTERGRERFRGIETADSITLDPHKGMFLPYGTGCLLARDGRTLREAHSVGSVEYLQDIAPSGEPPNFTDYSPELSRDFRGLRVWLPIKLHGLAAFRDALEEKLVLARAVYEALRDTPGFDLPWEPELSIVAFRYRPRAGDPEGFNRRLIERINASRRIFLSSTVVGGRFYLRAAVLSHRTHRDRIEEAIEIIRRSAAELDSG